MNDYIKGFAAAAIAGAATTFAMTPMIWPIGAALAATQPAAKVVHIANFTFASPAITVKRGTTVTWVNDDDIPHTVVANDKSFKSKVLDTGDRFSVTFNKAGQIAYFCSLHPRMTAKVIVTG
jgi:plastocyanin